MFMISLTGNSTRSNQEIQEQTGKQNHEWETSGSKNLSVVVKCHREVELLEKCWRRVREVL